MILGYDIITIMTQWHINYYKFITLGVILAFIDSIFINDEKIECVVHKIHSALFMISLVGICIIGGLDIPYMIYLIVTLRLGTFVLAFIEMTLLGVFWLVYYSILSIFVLKK